MAETTNLTIQRFSAFSDGNERGNPAGVVIAEEMPTPEDMQKIAAEAGYSETAFAAPKNSSWRVRYFAPNCEVAFCGHATIALGAALAELHGDGDYSLVLNDGCFKVIRKMMAPGQPLFRLQREAALLTQIY